ncbi:MAG: LPS export ABC transporter periplasmic protein LptC [Steroidobacteraceae bacterium]
MRRWSVLAIAPALAAGMLAGCGLGERARGGAATEARAAGDGYAATGAELLETAPDGSPRLRLQAQRIDQDPRTRVVRLGGLEMRVSDERDGEWRLRAARGVMPEDATRVDLAGDVHVYGRPAADEQPIEIRSDALAYDADAQRVTSATDVTILLSGQQLTARGLDADLKARHVQLESRVHGRFVP